MHYLYIHQILHQTMKLNNGKNHLELVHVISKPLHHISLHTDGYCDVDHCVLLHFKEN